MIFKKKSFYLSLAPVFFLLLFSLIGSFFTPHDPFEQQLQQSLLPPSSEYICGTDLYGRCVFSRILAGAPLSVFTALLLTAAVALIGTAAGMCSGYYRGSCIDKLLQHLTNIVLAFPLAPLHNPANITGIQACQKVMPGVPMVGVFDTAFHQTMPAKSYIYALPYEYYEQDKVRRYGFHGTSHRYVSQRAAAMLGKPIEEREYS